MDQPINKTHPASALSAIMYTVPHEVDMDTAYGGHPALVLLDALQDRPVNSGTARLDKCVKLTPTPTIRED